jgi:hypothetical protein
VDEHQKHLISNLAHFGEVAFTEYWKTISVEHLEKSWWNALLFAFDHVFFQGRRDALSQRYRNHAVAALQNKLDLPIDHQPSDPELDHAYAALGKALPTEEQIKTYVQKKKTSKKEDRCKRAETGLGNRTSLLEELTPHFGSHTLGTKRERDALGDRLPLNKPADLLMLLGLLRFVTSDADHKNIFGFVARGVRDGDLRDAYTSLDRVYGIDDKIAAFITRDVYLLLKRDGHVLPQLDDEQWKFSFRSTLGSRASLPRSAAWRARNTLISSCTSFASVVAIRRCDSTPPQLPKDCGMPERVRWTFWCSCSAKSR